MTGLQIWLDLSLEVCNGFLLEVFRDLSHGLGDRWCHFAFFFLLKINVKQLDVNLCGV